MRLLSALATLTALLHDTTYAVQPRAGAIHAVGEAPHKRSITIDDYATVRHVDTLSPSPDGTRYAVLVRQGDPKANEYHWGWYVGHTHGGSLTFVGDAGEARPFVDAVGNSVGEIGGREARWSPDGQWIAYLVRREGEVQLWQGKVDGSVQRQLTHNAADVQEFVWSNNGGTVYFTTGIPRAERRLRREEKARHGLQFDEDLYLFTDAMRPSIVPPEKNLFTWAISVEREEERLASEQERSAFQSLLAHDETGGIQNSDEKDRSAKSVTRADNAQAWLKQTSRLSSIVRVMVTLPSRESSIPCTAEACAGAIQDLWWSDTGQRIFFWRGEGINNRSHAFYAWTSSTQAINQIYQSLDDDFRLCHKIPSDRLICVRETLIRPDHLVSLDLRSGKLKVLSEINPAFRDIAFGKVERFEWDTPQFRWSEPGAVLEGVYPKRAYGYIFYPPGFDRRRKYPVFIEPYVTHHFDAAASEHALHVYAANGFIVLDTAFPATIDVFARLGPSFMSKLYSEELDFPHLTMLAESTLRGLDVAVSRGFIDKQRVGIGGVSHGTFVPLYILQKHDRIAAISISSATWGPHEYYWGTRKIEEFNAAEYGEVGYEEWRPKPEGPGQEFWSRIDIADHVDAIKAPIMMNLPDVETYAQIRLLRHLRDAHKPYDAYIFPEETHIKWQPAHLYNIMNRNLDWFRFWLQGIEDTDPAKADQYSRWQLLRQQQCRNSGAYPFCARASR